ncbi:MAG: phage major capsid protein [Gammaproteobacteria bacterium]
MPQFGTGIIPSGALGNELSAITRRAFINKLIVQLYQASPTIALLMSHANAASGGVSPITIPAQMSALTIGQWTDFSGSFAPPQDIAGIDNAEFNMKALVVPIPLLGMQAMVQINETVIDKLEAVMNDAGNNAINMLAIALFNNITNNQQLIGLPGAVDDGTNLVTYGGLSRTTFPQWKSLRIAEGGVNPTRNSTLLDVIKTTTNNGGERPTFGVCGPLTWHKLATDFTTQERYMVAADGSYADNEFGARAAFQALMVGGVPYYFDPYAGGAAEGTVYLLNENYLSLYIHEDFSFGFTGFESVLPNSQLGYIGALLSLLELVLAKPAACGVFTGYLHS